MMERRLLSLSVALLLTAQTWSAANAPDPGATSAGSHVSDCRDLLTWRQDQNAFYSNQIPVAVFDKIAEQKGLDTLEDFNQPPIQALLGDERYRINTRTPSSVIEIGSGYGRIYGALTAMKNLQKVTGVEIGDAQIAHLRQRFEEQNRTRFYPENVGKPDALHKGIYADLALWLFAGILELSPDEKTHAVRNLHQAMAKGGWLVVDLPLPALTTSLTVRRLSHKGVLLLSKESEHTVHENGAASNTFRLHPFKRDDAGDLVVDFESVITTLTQEGLFRQAELQFWVPAPEAGGEATVRKTNRWEYDPKGNPALRRVLYFFRKN